MTDELDNNDDNPDGFTDEDKAAIADGISEGDLRGRFQALEDAQEEWEKVAYVAVPKIPCPECGGAGQISGGSFGDICVGCMGARVVAAPGAEGLDMPDFRGFLSRLSAYAAAMDDRALPDGHRTKKNLALPPASSVPTLAELTALEREAKKVAKQLKGMPGVVPAAQLAAAKKAKGLAGEGDLGEYEEHELDEMIADAEIVGGEGG